MSGILMMSVGNSYGSLPVNTVAPVVSGTATVGSTLTTTNGTWTGAPTPTFTYQWQRNTSNISGATSSTYVVQLADVGFTLRCVVTGTNSVGSASANSNSTATVASPYWASFLASPSDVLRTYDNVRDSSNNLYSVGVIGGTTGGGFVTKYNSAGALLWQRLINDTSSPGQFNARGVAVDSSGNVYVVGSWASVGHIIKFDPSGNVIFRKQTGGIGTAFLSGWQSTAPIIFVSVDTLSHTTQLR